MPIELNIDLSWVKNFINDICNKNRTLVSRDNEYCYEKINEHLKMKLHRYKSDTVSVILNDYLRNFITKLEATKDNLEAVGISIDASKSEKTKALKQIENIKNFCGV